MMDTVEKLSVKLYLLAVGYQIVRLAKIWKEIAQVL